MRRIALAVLGFGVIAGFGSSIAHARHRMACHQQWRESAERFENRDFRGFGPDRRDFDRFGPAERVAPPAPASAQSQPVIVQAAPAAAPSQVFIVMPGASPVALPQVVNAAPAAVAPQAQTVTPAPNGP